VLAATRTSDRPVGARARCRAAPRTPGAATTSTPSKLNSAKVTGLQGRPPVRSQPLLELLKRRLYGRQISERQDCVVGSDVRRTSRSVSPSPPRGVILARGHVSHVVSITRNHDLNHGEPVISGDDNALFGPRQLMSNRDSEQIAWVVIDTILFFPTHQDFAHAFRRATFTASRSQLEAVRHGTSVRPSSHSASRVGAITATPTRSAAGCERAGGGPTVGGRHSPTPPCCSWPSGTAACSADQADLLELDRDLAVGVDRKVVMLLQHDVGSVRSSRHELVDVGVLLHE
jgi:hypothetical protein